MLNFYKDCDEMIKRGAERLFNTVKIPSHTFSVNDYVYYQDEQLNTIPCVIKEVRGEILILSDGHSIYEVEADMCKFQNE